ncbi:MAG: hypothetical protein WD971_03530 [Pirellulales bacterium]
MLLDDLFARAVGAGWFGPNTNSQNREDFVGSAWTDAGSSLRGGVSGAVNVGRVEFEALVLSLTNTSLAGAGDSGETNCGCAITPLADGKLVRG